MAILPLFDKLSNTMRFPKYLQSDRNIRVAIVHDYIHTFGGSERVLLALHRIWPQAKIYTASINYKNLGVFASQIRQLNANTSWIQKIPLFVKYPLLYRPILPMVWKTIRPDNVDVVISSSGANIAKGVCIPTNTMHICYCHTPPKYIYGYETETNFIKLPIISLILRPVIMYLKRYDLSTNQHIDYFIANSMAIQKRIKKHYSRKSIVIYPPVNILRPTQQRKFIMTNYAKYYLMVSRLVNNKNIDLVVKSFNKIKRKLIIVGKGPEGNRLQTMSNKNIEFIGETSDTLLNKYYKNCSALIVAAQDEDFGITAVEAQSFGKPVIAYNSGGFKETVVNNKTGVFFKKMTEESLIRAVLDFEKRKFNESDCYKNSLRFSTTTFNKKVRNFVLSKVI